MFTNIEEIINSGYKWQDGRSTICDEEYLRQNYRLSGPNLGSFVSGIVYVYNDWSGCQRPSEEPHESLKLNQDKNMAKLHIQSFSSLHLVCGFSAGRSELKPDMGPYFYSSSDSERFWCHSFSLRPFPNSLIF